VLSQGLQWLLAGVMLVVFAVVDTLYTGAGFGLYVNSRTLIEGWDIELALKRMRDRLEGIARPAGLLLGALLLLATSQWAEAMPPDELEMAQQAQPAGETQQSDREIHSVLADEDFKVHSVEERVPVAEPSSPRGFNSSGFGGFFAMAFAGLGWLLLALLVGGVGWLIWRYWPKPDGAGAASVQPLRREVRTVMGMDIGPDSLPTDIPSAAWRAWQAGNHQEAMSLLYRGAIGAFVGQIRVEIDEGDTERDCLRRVSQLGMTREARYFEGLTNSWMGLAYGRSVPEEGEMQALCRDWPFAVQGGHR
jgi:hypothetical protein